jgi:preprotein translocase subunit YajC
MNISSVIASDNTTLSNNPNILSLLMILIFAIITYFMLIKPQRKKVQELKEIQNNMQINDEVKTNSGIIGIITKIENEFVNLKIGINNNTECTIQKESIAVVLPKGTFKYKNIKFVNHSIKK